jgi:hypothetical protein
MLKPVEIVCSACGADTLLKREPQYEGFRKVGERLLCTSCGHEYPSEAEVPFRQKRKLDVFTADDAPKVVRVFANDEKGRNCRYCRHYVVNPFTQRCGLHDRVVQATGYCEDFDPQLPRQEPVGGDASPSSAAESAG